MLKCCEEVICEGVGGVDVFGTCGEGEDPQALKMRGELHLMNPMRSQVGGEWIFWGSLTARARKGLKGHCSRVAISRLRFGVSFCVLRRVLTSFGVSRRDRASF